MKKKGKPMNMKVYRIWAIVLRYVRESNKDIFMIADYIYWPIMDIFMWGMMSSWMVSTQTNNTSHLVLVILSGLIFWHVIYQANIEIAKNILEEFWTQNLINLFSSPLTIHEWLIAVMFMGFIRMIFIIVLGASTLWLFYALNILDIGWIIIPFVSSLLMTGWFMGIFTAAIILYGGMRAQWLAWATGWLLAPFCGVFYAVEMLPKWVQLISYSLPPTYIFQGMRAVLLHQVVRYDYLAISFLLNFFYLALSLVFFTRMFDKSRTLGLARLE